jgi:hypothetical protein
MSLTKVTYSMIDGAPINVLDFGAVGDGVADDTAAIQAAVNFAQTNPDGGVVFLPTGRYKITSAINFDRSSDTSRGRVSLQGANLNSSILVGTHAGPVLSIKNGTVTGNESVQLFQNFQILGPSRTAGSIGIETNVVAFITFRNVYIEAFDFGIFGENIDQAAFDRVFCRFNNKGIYLAKDVTPVVPTASQPNNVTFFSCTVSNNIDYGLYCIGGSNVNFYGGNVENNGTVGINGFGLKFEDCGLEGGIGANINGVYFESNNGSADVWIIGDFPAPTFNAITHNVIACSFHRVSDVRYTVNSILAKFGDPVSFGKQVLNVSGSTFKSGNGPYVPSALRKYIAFTDTQPTVDNFYNVGNLFEDAVETPDFLQNVNKRYATAVKTANQSVASGSFTKWLLDSVVVAEKFLWTPALSSNSVVIDVTGLYLVTATITWTSPAVAEKYVRIKNNSTVVAIAQTDTDAQTVSALITCDANDLISVEIRQDTGGAIDVAGSSIGYSGLKILQLL